MTGAGKVHGHRRIRGICNAITCAVNVPLRRNHAGPHTGGTPLQGRSPISQHITMRQLKHHEKKLLRKVDFLDVGGRSEAALCIGPAPDADPPIIAYGLCVP